MALPHADADERQPSNSIQNSRDEDYSDGVEQITRQLIGLMGKVQETTSLSNPSSKENIEKNIERGFASDTDNAENICQATKNFDRVIARELYEQSPKDREEMLDEIHGIQSRAIPETREKISNALQELEQEIYKHVQNPESNDLVEAHNMAVNTLGSDYVMDPNFRIRFLRAELFDIQKAALRYFRCLNHLLKYFGKDSLLRPLRVEDLTSAERAFLAGGKLQALRSRDRMGRRVLLLYLNRMSSAGMLLRQRVETYLLFGVLAEDRETQRHGAVCVAVLFDLGKDCAGRDASSDLDASSTDDERVQNHAGLTEDEDRIYKRFVTRNLEFRLRQNRVRALPLRWSSFHLIMADRRIYHIIKSLIFVVIPARVRKFARVHTGSYLECIYQLKQFGIPVEDIPGPSAKGVVIKTKSLARFLRSRNSVDSFRKEQYLKKRGALLPAISESSADACPGTDCPESNCVVFGDRLTYAYPANVAFRHFLRDKEKSQSHSNESPSAFLFGTNSKTSLRLNVQFLDQIIDEMCLQSNPTSSSSYACLNTILRQELQERGFRFATYEKENGWYRYIDPIQSTADRIELRKRISQTIRDDRKRTLRSTDHVSRRLPSQIPFTNNIGVTNMGVANMGVTNMGVANMGVANIGVTNMGVANMGVDPTMYFGGSTNSTNRNNPFAMCIGNDERFGFDAKRFKTDHDQM